MTQKIGQSDVRGSLSACMLEKTNTERSAATAAREVVKKSTTHTHRQQNILNAMCGKPAPAAVASTATFTKQNKKRQITTANWCASATISV